MHVRKSLSRIALVGAAAIASVSLFATATAHVGTEPGSVEAGKSATVGFRVGHGCDGSPTLLVRMQIPDGVVGVKPEAMPGWDIETVLGPIEPYDSHGTTIAEGVKEITWSGGSLPDDQFAVFAIRATFPDTPGETLYFPVIQQCETGSHEWIEIPEEGQDGHDLESPAPTLELVAATSSDHGHGSDGHDDEEASTDASTENTNPGGSTAETSVPAQSSDDPSTVAWLALGVAVVGLVAGAGGFAMGVRKR